MIVFEIKILIFFILISCAEEDYAKITGAKLSIKNCPEGKEKVFQPFEMEFNFISFHNIKDTVNIIMKRGFKAKTLSDGFYLQIKNFNTLYEKWQKNKESEFLVGTEDLRTNLLLLETCPSSHQNISAKDGILTWSELGKEEGEKVEGKIKFNLYDEQANLNVGEFFECNFSFIIRNYPPYQSFAN